MLDKFLTNLQTILFSLFPAAGPFGQGKIKGFPQPAQQLGARQLIHTKHLPFFFEYSTLCGTAQKKNPPPAKRRGEECGKKARAQEKAVGMPARTSSTAAAMPKSSKAAQSSSFLRRLPGLLASFSSAAPMTAENRKIQPQMAQP